MAELNFYEQQTSIDGVDTGPITQAKHREQKAEMYRNQRRLGAYPLPEVEVVQVPEVESQEQIGE